jgi:hypothetical protein
VKTAQIYVAKIQNVVSIAKALLDTQLHCNFSFGCFRVQPSVGYAGHKRLVQSGRPRLGTRTQEGGHHQKTGRHGHKRRHHGHAVSTRFILLNAPNFLCKLSEPNEEDSGGSFYCLKPCFVKKYTLQ